MPEYPIDLDFVVNIKFNLQSRTFFHFLMLLHLAHLKTHFNKLKHTILSVKRRNVEMCNKINEILLHEILHGQTSLNCFKQLGFSLEQTVQVETVTIYQVVFLYLKPM